MPIYEYTCMDCKKPFTVLQKMGQTEAGCPWCSSANTVKQLSKFSCSPGHDGASSGTGHFGGT